MLTNENSSSGGNMDGKTLAGPGSFSCPAFVIDPAGTILETNAAFAALFPIKSIKLDGLDVYGLQAFGRHITAVAAGLREKVEEALSTGTKVAFDEVLNGKIYRHSIEPAHTPEGEISRLLVTVRDDTGITSPESKRAETFSSIFETIPGHGYSFDEISNLLAMMLDIARHKLTVEKPELQEEKTVADRTLNRLMEIDHIRNFLGMTFHEYCAIMAISRKENGSLDLKMNGGDRPDQPGPDTRTPSSGRLMVIIEDYMRQALASESITESPKDFRIAPIIDTQADTFRTIWPESPLNCSGNLAESELSGDPSLIKVVIFNLLDNARKYSPPHSPIVMESSLENDSAVIMIRNVTSGITQDEAGALFEKYRRGSNSGNTAGAGLGLWLVREIVRRYDGQVALESIESVVEVTVRIPLSRRTKYQVSVCG